MAVSSGESLLYHDFLYSPVSAVLWAARLPPCLPVFSPLMDPRKLLIFQSIQIFSSCLVGVVTSKFSTCGTGYVLSPNWIFKNMIHEKERQKEGKQQ